MNVRRNTGLTSVLFMLVIIQIVSPMVIGSDSLSNMRCRDDVAFYYYDKCDPLNQKPRKEQFHTAIPNGEMQRVFIRLAIENRSFALMTDMNFGRIGWRILTLIQLMNSWLKVY